MELKAFIKSSLTSAPSWSTLWSYILAAWTASSAIPPLTAQPNCQGASNITIFTITFLPVILATSQQRVHPTEIGWIPPLGFNEAVELAPKKKGNKDVGVLPSRTNLTKEVGAGNRTLQPLFAEGLIISFIYWVSNYLAPSRVNGKDIMALAAFSSYTEIGWREPATRKDMRRIRPHQQVKTWNMQAW